MTLAKRKAMPGKSNEEEAPAEKRRDYDDRKKWCRNCRPGG